MARIRTVFTGVAGTPWYSNLYFGNDGAGDNSQNGADAVATFWATIRGAINSSVSWQIESAVAQIEEETGDLVGIETVVGSSNNGSGADEPLPWQTQALIRLNTQGFVHSRNVRGRIFVPGLGESNNGTGVPTSSLRTALDAAAAGIITDSTGTLVVWSRPFAGAEGNPARIGTYHLVDSATTDDKWSVLRSRRD